MLPVSELGRQALDAPADLENIRGLAAAIAKIPAHEEQFEPRPFGLRGAQTFDIASSSSALAEKRAEPARIREDKVLAELEMLEAEASEEDRSRCSGTSSQKRRDRYSYTRHRIG